VDDDPELRAMLSFSLELAGHSVKTAIHGRDALAQLQDVRPAVILLDLMMPVMDGVEFWRALRQHPSFANTPVVCLSAKHSAQAEAKAMGMVCITKPFEIDDVTRVVAQFADEPGRSPALS
jgi:CheY-like chemotaxis protein